MSGGNLVWEQADHAPIHCPHCDSIRSRATAAVCHRGLRFRTRKCVNCKRTYSTCEAVISTTIYRAIVLEEPFTFQVPDHYRPTCAEPLTLADYAKSISKDFTS